MIGTALIGYGYWGKILSGYLMDSSLFDLKHIVVRNLPHETGNFTTDLEEVLHDSSIEAVVIASPLHTHFELAAKCLLAGKHVLCEKPLTTTLHEAVKLKSMSTTQSKLLETNFLYSFSPGFRHIKSILQQLPAPEQMNFTMIQPGKIYPGENVYQVLGCHMMALVLNLCGNKEPFEIQYKHEVMDEHNQTQKGKVYLSRNSLRIVLDLNLLANKKFRIFRALGHEYELHYDLIQGKLTFIEGGRSTPMDFDESNNIRYSLEHFYAAISGKVNSNIEDSVKIIEWLEFSKS